MRADGVSQDGPVVVTVLTVLGGGDGRLWEVMGDAGRQLGGFRRL